MLKRLAMCVFWASILPIYGQRNNQQPPPLPAPHVAVTEVKTTETNHLLKDGGTGQQAASKLVQSWSLGDKIALIASVSAFLQFLALVVTVWVMIINGRRQLRAYVIVGSGIIGNVADPPSGPGERVQTVARLMQPLGGPVALITIKNTGQTPAYEVVHWGNIVVREFPLTSELPEMPKSIERHKSNLGPSIGISKALRLPRPLSIEDIEALRKSRMAIYCNGEIHYRDAFKKRRVTKYRCMYCAVNGEEIGTNTDLTLCEDGNTAN